MELYDFASHTLGEVIAWIAGAVIVLSGIVQISPIKLNPWSWLAKRIGRAINAEVIAKVGKLEDDIEAMHAGMDEKAARDARSDILRFGDELRLGIKHSKEAFDNILVAINEYDEYCQEHPKFKNRMTDITKRYIEDIYDKCLRENTFL